MSLSHDKNWWEKDGTGLDLMPYTVSAQDEALMVQWSEELLPKFDDDGNVKILKNRYVWKKKKTTKPSPPRKLGYDGTIPRNAKKKMPLPTVEPLLSYSDYAHMLLDVSKK